FRQNALIPIVGHGGRAMALAELLPIQPVDHGHVREAGRLVSERPVEQDLLGRVGYVIVAAHYQRDAHGDVIRYHRHVVNGSGIGAEDDEVFDVLVGEVDVVVNDVVPAGCPVRNAEAHDERIPRCNATGDGIGIQ